ncbi:MAG: hypothetical protein ACJ705_04355 [Nitrososphaeraceae archaeon]
MIDLINAGSLSLMLSIGHRTRIFDVMAELPSPLYCTRNCFKVKSQ